MHLVSFSYIMGLRACICNAKGIYCGITTQRTDEQYLVK